MSLDTLRTNVVQKQRELQEKKGAMLSLQSRLAKHQDEVVLLEERMANTEKAVHLIQSYSQDQQALLSSKVETIVTAGIRAVFQDQNLVFRLHYSESKGGAVKKTPEVTMSVLYRSGDEEHTGDLRNSFGGGLAVVTAALLNIVVVLLMVPRVAPIVLWDEPLRDLSPPTPDAEAVAQGYRARMADFLRTLVDQTEVQLIMVSHEPQYAEVADYNHHFSGGIGKAPKVRTTQPTQGDE